MIKDKAVKDKELAQTIKDKNTQFAELQTEMKNIMSQNPGKGQPVHSHELDKLTIKVKSWRKISE